MCSYQTEIEDFHVPADIETNVGYRWTKATAMRFNEDFWIQTGIPTTLYAPGFKSRKMIECWCKYVNAAEAKVEDMRYSQR